MKRIDEDIKNGQFKSCYLLYGEEAYLIKQYRDKLKRALVKEGDTMNFAAYEGKGTIAEELIDLAETMPFFAEHRVILLEDSGFFKHSCEALAEYLPEMNQSACFLFVESEVDKRSKMYKAVKKYGTAVEFSVQNEALIAKWILVRIGREKKKITKQVLSFFLGRTGLDMSVIDKELEKLLCYTLGKEVIEKTDVEAVVTERTENKIFEMIDAIAGHNREKALDLYYGLLSLKESPLRILYLLVRQFRILSQIKELAGKGYGSLDIAKKTKIPEFAVRKNQAQAGNFTKDRLLAAVLDGASAEEDVKMGRMTEKIAVELLILKYSKKEEREWI